MNRGRKFAGLVLSAMLFGTVAGGTMVGVNALSDQYRSEVLTQAANDAEIGRASCRERVCQYV